jgi:carbonic anhydrase
VVSLCERPTLKLKIKIIEGSAMGTLLLYLLLPICVNAQGFTYHEPFGHEFIQRGDTWEYRPCITQDSIVETDIDVLTTTCSDFYSPRNWATSTGNATCGSGLSQSPINIPVDLPKETSFPKFRLNNWNITPENATLKNTGHNVEYDFNIDLPLAVHPTTSGGGLDGTYILAQGHFHWGSQNNVGSEHKIDHVQYPMELHLVHYKKSFENSALARDSETRDGLAVLSILFHVQQQDNPNMAGIIAALHDEELTWPPTPVRIGGEDPLLKLLPGNLDRFYRYYGSLTTPPCSESVAWTIFKETVGISAAQLQAFRRVKRNWEPCGKQLCDTCDLVCERDIPLINNFRPSQNLNNRNIVEVDLSGK